MSNLENLSKEELIKRIQEKSRKNPEYRRMILERAKKQKKGK